MMKEAGASQTQRRKNWWSCSGIQQLYPNCSRAGWMEVVTGVQLGAACQAAAGLMRTGEVSGNGGNR